MTEQAEQIKKRIVTDYPSMHIARLPLNTLKRFKAIASADDFCDDCGMTLRELVKEHYELIELKKFLYNNVKIVVKDDK